MLIEVSFKGNRREFFDWPFPEAPPARTAVIVEAERGEDLGHVHATGDLAELRKKGTTHGKATREPLRKVVRAANSDEVAKANQLRSDETNVRVRAIEKVRALGLDLKVSDTEWQWDKKRLTVYFTAEQRVDFRVLVRQLEGLFGTRVHMWHIGVRDEAKRVDGVGRCGRQLCSASWLPELVPVKSSVAKDQMLSTLNPAQISGACGRLMCCLRYEHEFYVEQRRRFPKEGKIIRTPDGEEKVLSIDIFRETVTLRNPAGETRVIPLASLPLASVATEAAPEKRQAPLPPRDVASVPASADLAASDRAVDAAAVDVADESDDGEEPADDGGSQGDAGDRGPGEATAAHGREHRHREGGRRRRRGRRGGRRGRGGPPPPGAPPSGSPSGSPPGSPPPAQPPGGPQG